MTSKYDVIIIGAGHNGLVAAFYLAKAGLKPLVLERRPILGGCAITEEFHPGFRCSTLAHLTGPIAPQVRVEMELEERHGLRRVLPDPVLFAPAPEGPALVLHNEPGPASREVAKFSSKDAQRYIEFDGFNRQLTSVLDSLLESAPLATGGTAASQLWELVKRSRRFRVGRKQIYRLLRYASMPVADLAAEWFESELLRAVIAARGIYGNFLGPRSPGSGAVLLLRCDGHPAGSAELVHGGMGALSEAMASAAREAGAEIRTGAEVAQILVKEGGVAGLALSSGEEIAAKCVVSNTDPRRTLLGLLEPVHLEPQFLLRVRNYRARGVSAKLNLVLDGLPSFTALRRTDLPASAALAGRIHIGPEVDYLERAFDAAKYGEFSPQPYLEATLPSLLDPTLVPEGKHVMSVYMQYAPFRLRNGDWRSQRDALADSVIRTLAAYAPDLPNRILARQVITPLDLEETYGLTGGHIFHGDLALDQLFLTRPLLEWARYRTPIRGLYLCGSGTHPGTGLTGHSGRNAAREILKDLRR